MRYLKIFIALFFFYTNSLVYAQCPCQNLKRDDGTTVFQCEASPVSFDRSHQLGLSLASNGQETYVGLTVRFLNESKDIVDDLSIRLKDNNMITLDFVKSQRSYIGNSNVTLALFYVDAIDARKIGASGLYTLTFSFNDKVVRTYECDQNTNVLISQMKCLSTQ